MCFLDSSEKQMCHFGAYSFLVLIIVMILHAVLSGYLLLIGLVELTSGDSCQTQIAELR